jgi:hypothetical protein
LTDFALLGNIQSHHNNTNNTETSSSNNNNNMNDRNPNQASTSE